MNAIDSITFSGGTPYEAISTSSAMLFLRTFFVRTVSEYTQY